MHIHVISFAILYNHVIRQVAEGRISIFNGIVAQVYDTTNPFTILLSSSGKPLVKFQCDNSGIYTLYFQKKDTPYEIGYTGFRFHETDPIDKLLAKDILNEYPVAREVYEHLMTLFNEREDN